QATAAVEALGGLDRGVEELVDEDERSLRRYTLALERDACRQERERLRELEKEEAEAVADVAKSEADEREQVADLAQLELIASKALSSKSAQ
ncbi:unnamed protein product, partial [Ectocarpus sp. 8 AP-2014]